MNKRFAKAYRRVNDLSGSDWRYLAVAAKELFLARIRIAIQPVETIVRTLQNEPKGCRDDLENSLSDVDVARLKWAINVVAVRMPWRCDCLPQAMAADRWLRRYHLQPKFFLGVAKNAAGQLEAHAWLQYREIFVTGASGGDYTPLLEPVSHQGPQSTEGADGADRKNRSNGQ
jgi:hypothetical protein